MSRQASVDSLLLSVAAGQPSDSIAIVCSIESTILAMSPVWHNNPLGGAFNLAVKIEKVTTLNAGFRIRAN